MGYLLVFNPPDDAADTHGLGWSLVTYRRGNRCGSLNLAAHGANATAGPRVGKAVAVRVLADQGIAVRGWRELEPADQFGAYQAELGPSEGHPRRP